MKSLGAMTVDNFMPIELKNTHTNYHVNSKGELILFWLDMPFDVDGYYVRYSGEVSERMKIKYDNE